MDFLRQVAPQVQHWFADILPVQGALSQFLVILAALLISFLASRFLIYPRIDSTIKEPGEEWTLGRVGLIMVKRLSLPVIMIFWLWIAHGVARHFDWAHGWFNITEVLLMAWIMSRLIISFIMFQVKITHKRTTIVVITFVIWLLAMLEISHLLNPALTILDHIAIKFWGFRLSLLHLIAGALILLVFLGLNRVASQAFSDWITSTPSVSPSFQALFSKLFKVGLYTLAIILTLSGLGFDLTNLAWLSGALGLGLGFGLQKVISNLASGFIILADRSIKPGDVIQVGDTYGWVNNLKSRYISVITRDGIEYLIPNEEMITGKVINWSYSHDLVRVKISVGVAYGSDLQLVMKLMLEAVAAAPRVLASPEPSCRFMNFGDSAINFQLRVWINDPQEGLSAVTSEVLLEVWKRFQEHGIVIPFPQRVLHHRPAPEPGTGDLPPETKPEVK